MSLPFAALVLALAAPQPPPVPADSARASLSEGVVELVASLPVSAFGVVDTNHDGALSPEEFAAHQDELITAARSLIVVSGHGRAGRIESESVALAGGQESPSRQLVVRRRVAWETPVTQFELDTPYLESTRTTLDVTGTRGPNETEAMTFDPTCRYREFFVDELSTASWIALLLGGVALAAVARRRWRRGRA